MAPLNNQILSLRGRDVAAARALVRQWGFDRIRLRRASESSRSRCSCGRSDGRAPPRARPRRRARASSPGCRCPRRPATFGLQPDGLGGAGRRRRSSASSARRPGARSRRSGCPRCLPRGLATAAIIAATGRAARGRSRRRRGRFRRRRDPRAEARDHARQPDRRLWGVGAGAAPYPPRRRAGGGARRRNFSRAAGGARPVPLSRAPAR